MDVSFKCSESSKIPAASGTFEVTCGTDGNFVAPAAWPECYEAVKCEYAPEPPASSNWELEPLVVMPLMQGKDAIYRCKSGFEWATPAPGDPEWDGIDDTTGK